MIDSVLDDKTASTQGLQVTCYRSMEEILFQFYFSAAIDRVSQRDLLYKLRSLCVGEQFLSIVSKFLSDRRYRVHLNV